MQRANKPTRFHRSKTILFIDNKPYRKIKHNRGKGEYLMYSLYDEEMVLFSHNDFSNKFYYAYTTTGAAFLLNRSPRTIKRLVRDGYAPSAYVKLKFIRETGLYVPGRYLLSKESILELHEALIIRTNRGAPYPENRVGTKFERKSDVMKASNIPTKQELESQLRTDTLLYARNNNGDFVRIWEAEDW